VGVERSDVHVSVGLVIPSWELGCAGWEQLGGVGAAALLRGLKRAWVHSEFGGRSSGQEKL